MKIMKDPTTGKQLHVLLTNGLSEIWGIDNLQQAVKTAQMLTENSDSGHIYEVRGEPCHTSKFIKVSDLIQKEEK
tara:strand:+ start:540 stop:764 length:225 start_codon:yes stop_codon:yes gene_type:complete